jgi:hypothetical protein
LSNQQHSALFKSKMRKLYLIHKKLSRSQKTSKIIKFILLHNLHKRKSLYHQQLLNWRQLQQQQMHIQPKIPHLLCSLLLPQNKVLTPHQLSKRHCYTTTTCKVHHHRKLNWLSFPPLLRFLLLSQRSRSMKVEISPMTKQTK